MGICCMAQETQTGYCINLEAWDGEGDGREVQKGGESMAIHSSTLAWKVPWTEELGKLQSMGSQRVGQD